MNSHAYLEHGMTILKTRLSGAPFASSPAGVPADRPFITLSREVCAGASTICHCLLPKLDAQLGAEGEEWVLLDKDLLGYALACNELPQQLARYLPEDQISEIDAMIGEVFGLHPSIWELEQRVAHAIVQLAHVGRVVFVGRAAHFLTQSLPGGFHVRLVAPRDLRISRLMALEGIGEAEAAAFVERTDHGRRRFVKSHFGRDIDDPHTYDLVLNTERISAETAASLIAEGLAHRVGSPRPATQDWLPGPFPAVSDPDAWKLHA